MLVVMGCRLEKSRNLADSGWSWWGARAYLHVIWRELRVRIEPTRDRGTKVGRKDRPDAPSVAWI